MKCPSCSSPRVYPSRLRDFFERARHRLTGKEPYRCHECGWRNWREPVIYAEARDACPDDLRTGRGAPPLSANDFDRLEPSTREP